MTLDRRLGRFQIHLDTIDRRPSTARGTLKDILILEAKCTDGEHISYIGIHPDFDVVPVGCDIPAYQAETTSYGVVVWCREAAPSLRPTTEWVDFPEGPVVDPFEGQKS
jgi:hypothetical protein